jgi:hypothetical protein
MRSLSAVPFFLSPFDDPLITSTEFVRVTVIGLT